MNGNIDERTEKYLAEIAKEIGYIGTNNGWYTMEEILKKHGLDVVPQKIDQYDGYFNSNEIEILEYTVDGITKYCAQLGYQTDIDDYNIETIIFTRKPSREDIIKARTIENIKAALTLKRLTPEFKCWECGCPIHWTDIPGEFLEKYHYWEEQYCNQC